MIEEKLTALTLQLASLQATIEALTAKFAAQVPAIVAGVQAEVAIDAITGKADPDLAQARQRSADAVAAVEAEERKRTRRTKAEMEAAKAAKAAPVAPVAAAPVAPVAAAPVAEVDELDFGSDDEKNYTIDDVKAQAAIAMRSNAFGPDSKGVIKAEITRLGAKQLSELSQDGLNSLYAFVSKAA